MAEKRKVMDVEGPPDAKKQKTGGFCYLTLHVKLEGSNNIRITRNIFELETTESIKWIFIGGVWNDNVYPFQFPSHHNRVDHNIFQNKETPGHYITIDGSCFVTTVCRANLS